MHADYEAYELAGLGKTEKKKKAAAPDFLSVVRRPLLSLGSGWDMSYIAPPVLRTVQLGLGAAC